MIGIAITTRNRPEVLRYTLAKFAQFHDDNQLIVVIDDDSECWEENAEIVNEHGFCYTLAYTASPIDLLYNTKRCGIPRSKNVGFQYLKNYDHQFWFDDDCFPKCAKWYEPFIEAMEYQGHLLYLRNWAHIHPVLHFRNVVEYTGATACLMTFRKDMYDDIEGFHEGFSMYGRWHPALTNKMYLYNMVRYGTLFQVEKYIYAFDIDGKPKDFEHEFGSCMSEAERKTEGKK